MAALFSSQTEQTITIIIEDVNDNAPILSNLPSRIELPEDTPPEEIFTVVASDLDEAANSLLIYRIESVRTVPFSNQVKFV